MIIILPWLVHPLCTCSNAVRLYWMPIHMTLHAQNIYRDLPDEKNTGKKVTVRVIKRSETNLKASQESDFVNAKCQTFLRSFTIRHSVHSPFSPCLPPKILHKFLTMVSSFSSVLQSSQEKSKTMLMLSYYFLPFSLPSPSSLLWSRNFATMVTWRHISPLYSVSIITS